MKKQRREKRSIVATASLIPPRGAELNENTEEKKDGAVQGEEIWVNKFDEAAAASFRDKVMRAAAIDPAQPIVIYIDSYGGYVDSLAKMIDTMDEVVSRFGTTLITVCMGKAMSCGAILLSHGDVRYCGPHSRVMIHEVSGASWGDVHDVHNDAVETVRLNEHFLGLLATNCNIKGGYKGLRKLIKDRDGRDIWLDAQAALDFGIVDYVGLPRIVKLIQYTSTLPTDDESKPERRKRFAKIIKEAKQ